MKSIFKLLLLAIIVIIAFVLIQELPIRIGRFFHFNQGDLTIDSTFLSRNIPPDYLKILSLRKDCCNDSVHDELYFKQTTGFKLRNPISYFSYQKLYHLQILKIGSSYNLPLNENLIEKSLDFEEPHNAYYTTDKEDSINYWYKASVLKPEKKIHLNISGQDITTIIKNDTVACFYSQARKFEIRYNDDEKPDIYAFTTENMFNRNYKAIEILFFKHSNNLYLLIMSNSKYYKEGTLLNLLEHSHLISNY